MRRKFTAGLMGVVLSIGLASEALAAPNASATDRVKEDDGDGAPDYSETVEIVFTNCQSGPGYEASVVVTFPFSKYHTPADDDGTTVVSHWMHESPGEYTVELSCDHYTAPPNGHFYLRTTYTEEEVVIVEQRTGTLTAQEKKRCKRKPTPERRRRCRQKQAAD